MLQAHYKAEWGYPTTTTSPPLTHTSVDTSVSCPACWLSRSAAIAGLVARTRTRRSRGLGLRLLHVLRTAGARRAVSSAARAPGRKKTTAPLPYDRRQARRARVAV